MKKNEKDLRFLLKKNAGDQIFIIGIWLSVVLLLFLAAGAFLNFILGKIILSITTASIGVVILKNAWWVILIICLGIFISHALKTIYKSRVIIPERHIVLLECFGEFLGEDNDAIDESKGVIHEGLHFIFPYFNIFKIHNNVAYFLGKMNIELFEGIDKSKDFPIDVKDTSVNVTASIIIKMKNPIAAAYNIDDYQGFVVKKCEAALRKKCAQWDLDQLIEKRKSLNLISIFSEDESGFNENNPDKKIVDFEDFQKAGVEILDFIITDIGVQQKDLQQREKRLKEKSDQLAKIIELETRVKEAKAKQTIIEIETDTEAKRIKDLAEANAEAGLILSTKEGVALAEYLKESGLTIEQYLNEKALERLNESTTVITDSDGFVDLGTKLAVGASAFNKKQKEEEV